MKSFVILFPDYIAEDRFLQQFAYPGTEAIPCHETPVDAGGYLRIVPSQLDPDGQVAEPNEASIDGAIRIPHGYVRMIVDSDDKKAVGFLGLTGGAS